MYVIGIAGHVRPFHVFIFYWLLHGNGRSQLKEVSIIDLTCEKRPHTSDSAKNTFDRPTFP